MLKFRRVIRKFFFSMSFLEITIVTIESNGEAKIGFAVSNENVIWGDTPCWAANRMRNIGVFEDDDRPTTAQEAFDNMINYLETYDKIISYTIEPLR